MKRDKPVKPPFKERKLVQWLIKNAPKHAPNIIGNALMLVGRLTHKELLVKIGQLIEDSNDLTAEQKVQAKSMINE